MLVFQRIRIAVGLCDTHRRARRMVRLAGLVLLGAGIGAFYAAAADDDVLLGLGGLFAFIIGLVLASVMARMLYPIRITNEQARLGGCGPAFLESVVRRL